MIQNHFLRNFSFTVKEIDEVLDIIKLRNDAGHEYFREWVELNQRKEKLFQAGDPSKWEVDFSDLKLSPDDISKNRKIAKSVMLPLVG